MIFTQCSSQPPKKLTVMKMPCLELPVTCYGQ